MVVLIIFLMGDMNSIHVRLLYIFFMNYFKKNRHNTYSKYYASKIHRGIENNNIIKLKKALFIDLSQSNNLIDRNINTSILSVKFSTNFCAYLPTPSLSIDLSYPKINKTLFLN